ncbi:MAG TPA: hypothetical protein VEJ18_17745 [Planctomycetota bacterium]|nr:hypothetical protein [Planctomycetota bacterium]
MHPNAWAAAGVGAAGAAFLLYVAVARRCGFGRRPAAWNADCRPGAPRDRLWANPGSDLTYIAAGLAAVLVAEARGLVALLPLGVLMIWVRPAGTGWLDRFSVQAACAYVVAHEVAASRLSMGAFWIVYAGAVAVLAVATARPGPWGAVLPAGAALAVLATAGDVRWFPAAGAAFLAGAVLRRDAGRDPLCPAHREHHRIGADMLTAVGGLLVFLHMAGVRP